MAKRVKLAALIEQFIHHVDKGMIVGESGSSGPAVLKNMRAAAQAILDGADPDEALGIQRSPGAVPKPHTLLLAVAIHNLRAKREKWAVIEHHVNDYLRRIGEPELSAARIKALPKEHGARIKEWISRAEFFRSLREHSEKVT